MSGQPEQFGNYLLLERLAVGGMAEVFLARAPSAAGIAKFVAIKRILPQFSDNPEFIEMFKDEAKIAVNLSHSNIVSINGFDIVDGRFFIVMDYVEGKNLRQILNKMKPTKNRFSIEQIVFMIKEAAAGLDSAHRCLDGSTGKPLNLTHRDMSPQNIMISFEGQVKIVDFGIAKATTQLETTRAGTLKGKFGYMSPEQAEGLPIDLRTDVFSLGIVLWELLSTERLFAANNEMNTLRKIRNCEIPSLLKIDPNIPLELERITMKALAKDRNSRYQTASALHRDLNRFLNRHFPDFSSQEFSMSIKTMYTEEILENRKKLAAYAQLPSQATAINKGRSTPAEDNEDPTIVTEPTSAGDIRFDSSDYDSPIGGINLNGNAKGVLDENALNRTYTGITGDGKPMGLLTQPGINLSSDSKKKPTLGLPPLDVERAKPQKAKKANTASYKRPPKASQDYEDAPRSSWLSYVSLLLATVGGVYWTSMTYPDQYAHVKSVFILAYHSVNPHAAQKAELASQQNSSPETEINDPVLDAQQETLPPAPGEEVKASTHLILRSQPSGAEIIVNGQSTRLITPARLEVPQGEPFKLELRKSSYDTFVRNNVDLTKLKENTLDVQLIRAKEGFLDLDVRPPGNARVTIDEVAIKDTRLPLIRHRIPANKTVRVRAFNPVTRRSAEQIVKVKPDDRISVILDLNNPDKSFKRVPANR